MEQITELWTSLLKFILAPNFIIITLFVVSIIETLKNTLNTSTKPWFSTVVPFIALFLSFIGVFVSKLTTLDSWKEWLLEGLTQAFLVDIFYTFFGKPLMSAVKKVWEMFLKKADEAN